MAFRAPVHVVTNAGARQGDALPADVLAALDAACPGWIRHTCGQGEGPDVLARRALAAGAAVVVAHGGDGTVRAVAGVLAETDAVLALLPAGTANVFAAEAGVPADLRAAVALVTGEAPARVRAVDLGAAEIDGVPHVFLLRVGLGLQAAMTTDVSPAAKRRWGRLAYAAAGLRAWRALATHRYTVAADGGPETEVEGLSCLVCNTTTAGLPGTTLLAGADASDGRLDVLVARRLASWSVLWSTVRAVRIAAASVVESADVEVVSGRAVRLRIDPPQQAAVDGEALGQVREVRARVRPGALRVLVPARETVWRG